MTKSTKIMVVATIIVICVLCLTACNSAEKTAATDKSFDERVFVGNRQRVQRRCRKTNFVKIPKCLCEWQGEDKIHADKQFVSEQL